MDPECIDSAARVLCPSRKYRFERSKYLTLPFGPLVTCHAGLGLQYDEIRYCMRRCVLLRYYSYTVSCLRYL